MVTLMIPSAESMMLTALAVKVLPVTDFVSGMATDVQKKVRSSLESAFHRKT
ncbi:MAG: hypothetical protein MJY61_00215 [Bacteroidales bacterium]|nr:hypothetical protein [Bacteroidales bacterium]